METTIDQKHELSLKDACIGFLFAYMQKDVKKMLSYCNEDGYVQFTPMGESGIGEIGTLGKGIWTALIDCFPDIENTLDAAIADGENTVKCQVVISGTQAKEFAGIPSIGKRFESDHIFIFKMDDKNKIDSITVTWDHADFTKQLS